MNSQWSTSAAYTPSKMADTELGTRFTPTRRTSSVRSVTVSASVVDANAPHASIESWEFGWCTSVRASPGRTTAPAAWIPTAPSVVRSSNQRRVHFDVDASRSARLIASTADADERKTIQSSFLLWLVGGRRGKTSHTQPYVDPAGSAQPCPNVRGPRPTATSG